MSLFLVLVVLTLPGQQDPTQELHREWATASSASVCQQHAERLAAKQRQLHEETIQRLRATVRGVCIHQGDMP